MSDQKLPPKGQEEPNPRLRPVAASPAAAFSKVLASPPPGPRCSRACSPFTARPWPPRAAM